MWSSQSKNQPGSASANCECWPWNRTHHAPGGTTPSRFWCGLLGTVNNELMSHWLWVLRWDTSWDVTAYATLGIDYVLLSDLWGGEGQAGSWVLVFGKVWLCSLVHVLLFMATFLEIQSWNWIVLVVSAVRFRSSPLEKSWKSFKPMLCDELQLIKDERLQS